MFFYYTVKPKCYEISRTDIYGSFYGNRILSLKQSRQARNRVFARHPETTFVSLHMVAGKICMGFPALS